MSVLSNALAKSSAPAKIICFGELLLRMGAPACEKLLQSPRFEVCVGGAEANVAVSLAQFGHDAGFVSVVSKNDLGTNALGELRRYGVDVSAVSRTDGRMGLYFLSQGAVLRPSEVLYDRAHSAFTNMSETDLDWGVVLDGADWFHISGITPAVGAGPAASAIQAVKRASANGVSVSFDGNYRAQLWAGWKSDGPAVLREILGYASLAFINERDINLLFGTKFSPEERTQAFAFAFEECPNLQYIASTTRTLNTVSTQQLCAQMISRDGVWRSREYDISGIVDRIGAGDAFAAGVLHGLLAKSAPQYAIDFGMAASVIKHSIAGDFNVASIEDVESVMQGDGLDVKR